MVRCIEGSRRLRPLGLAIAAWIGACGAPDLDCETVGLVEDGGVCTDPPAPRGGSDAGDPQDAGAEACVGECADGSTEAGAPDGDPKLADSDEDGIDDAVDNCLGVENEDQADVDGDGLGDACDPDLDGDGVENDEDVCRSLPNPAQNDLDGDGLGDECDTDDDGDGLVDDADPCPLGSPSENDTDGDGCVDREDADDDDDGVPDENDGCPRDAASKAADVDGDGCALTMDACPLGLAVGPDDDGDGCKNDEDPTPLQFDSPKVPRVVYVDASRPAVASSGSSWDDAMRSLQDGLDRAEALYLDGPSTPVHVWVASGTYYPDDGVSVARGSADASFRLRDGVELYGGFRHDEEADRWVRDEMGGSVLDGDLAGNDPRPWGSLSPYSDLLADNSCSVVLDETSEGLAALDGFTVTHGAAVEHCSHTRGAGVRSLGNATFRRLLLVENYATSSGAGAATFGDSVWADVTFERNQTYFGFTALRVGPDSEVAVYGCRFRGNSTSDVAAAVSVDSGATLHMVNTVIHGNWANVRSPAMEVYADASIHALHTTIAGNGSLNGDGIRTAASARWYLRNSILLETVDGATLQTNPSTSSTATSGAVTEDSFVHLPEIEEATVEGDLRLRTDLPGRNPGVDRGDAKHLECAEALKGVVVPGLGFLCDETGTLRFDIEGNPRNQGAAPDVGAYETAP